jgi:hypothetical protein
MCPGVPVALSPGIHLVSLSGGFQLPAGASVWLFLFCQGFNQIFNLAKAARLFVTNFNYSRGNSTTDITYNSRMPLFDIIFVIIYNVHKKLHMRYLLIMLL